MENAKVACVRYLNTRPLIEGLEAVAGVHLVTAAPSHIAAMVRSGEADLGLASIVDAVGSPGEEGEPLAVLPVGMIGSDGPTMTVRLYAAVPLDEIEQVHADTESHTSVALCRVVLDRLYGISPAVVAFDARERMTRTGPIEWPEAMLLIGDKVVTDSPPAVRYPHQLDLGEAWKALTGLPFVYAAWMCRASEAGSSTIAAAAAVLDRQLRHNLTRLDWIIEQRAREHHWPADLARQYVGELLRYRLGEPEKTAATKFVQEAARLGLVADRAIEWVDWQGVLAKGIEPSLARGAL